MKLSRRNFLKFCGINAVALGLSSGVLSKLEQAMAYGEPRVIWLQGASCSGCTISTLNLIQSSGVMDAHDLLVDTIDLQYHGTVMGYAGDEAQQKITNALDGFILVVEGAIPTAFNGEACVLWEENGVAVTVKDALVDLASKASAIVCAGTCASFGGIPAAGDNPAKVKKVSEVISQDVINIPGCPVHPERLVQTLAKVIASETVTLLPQGGSMGGEIGRCHTCHNHAQDAHLLPYGHPPRYNKTCSDPGCHGYGQNLDEDDHPIVLGQSCSSCHSSGFDDDDYSYSSNPYSAFYGSDPNAESCHTCHTHIPTNEVQLQGSPFDNLNVPSAYFNKPICPCDRQSGGRAFEYGSSHQCQYYLGCRGSSAFSDCPSRKWHGGKTWCMEANAPCTACVHPSFPDVSNRALLKMGSKDTGVFMTDEREPEIPNEKNSILPAINLLLS